MRADSDAKQELSDWIHRIEEQKRDILSLEFNLKIEDLLEKGASEASTLLEVEKDPRIRQKVAANPRTPVRALRLLAEDPEPRVALVARRNPSTPLEALLEHPLADMSVLTRYQDHPSWDMIETLGNSWKGTLRELLEAVKELDTGREDAV